MYCITHLTCSWLLCCQIISWCTFQHPSTIESWPHLSYIYTHMRAGDTHTTIAGRSVYPGHVARNGLGGCGSPRLPSKPGRTHNGQGTTPRCSCVTERHVPGIAEGDRGTFLCSKWHSIKLFLTALVFPGAKSITTSSPAHTCADLFSRTR